VSYVAVPELSGMKMFIYHSTELQSLIQSMKVGLKVSLQEYGFWLFITIPNMKNAQ
jgi:hypothetical protein